MDSFEQQMLDEIERRYREYELSKSISFNNENIPEENENEEYSNIQQPRIISSKVSNFNFMHVVAVFTLKKKISGKIEFLL